MKYKGTVIFIGITQQVNANFAKRLLVISDKTEKYPQEVAFELTNDNCDFADDLVTGSMIEVDFNLRGKHWKDDKWFTSLNIWKIQKVQVSTSSQPQETEPKSLSNATDDLPF